MKHCIAAFGISLCVAAAFSLSVGVAGQESQPQEPPRTEVVSLTGCLVQGSGPSVFIFENAKADSSDGEEKGRTYLLTTDVTSISFREHLNHEVRIDGSAETRMPPIPPMGQKIKESELPKITATRVTHVATTCSGSPN